MRRRRLREPFVYFVDEGRGLVADDQAFCLAGPLASIALEYPLVSGTWEVSARRGGQYLMLSTDHASAVMAQGTIGLGLVH